MNGRGIFFLVAFILLSGIAFIAGRATTGGSDTPVAAQAPAVQPTKTASARMGETPAQQQGPRYPFDKYEVGDWSVNAIYAGEDEVWVGTTGGVVRYDIKTNDYEFFDNLSGLLSNGVLSISRVGDEIWLGTYGGGLSVFDRKTKSWRNFNINNGLGDPFVRDILIDKRGDAWVATWSGLNRIKGKELGGFANWELFTTQSTAGGLPHNRIYALAQDQDGGIWAATEKGVARFHQGKWQNWGHANGIGAAYDLVSDSAGKGVPEPEPVPAENQTGIKPAYKPDLVVALAVGEDGRVWAGTWGGGLSVYDGKEWSTYTMWDGLAGNYILSLTKGPKNGVWVGTGKGLVWFDGKETYLYRMQEGLFSNVVRSFSRESATDLWVGGVGGVSHFPKGLGIQTP